MSISKCTVTDLDCPPPQLRGCACSNVVGLLGAMLAFCLYCYSLSTVHNGELCVPISPDHEYRRYGCPGEVLMVSVLFSANLSEVKTKKRKIEKTIIGFRDNLNGGG